MSNVTTSAPTCGDPRPNDGSECAYGFCPQPRDGCSEHCVEHHASQCAAPDDTDSKDGEISTYLTRVIQAKCANCRLRETAQPDILKRAVELFIQRGWRVRGTKLLCKECVKLWN